MSRIVLAPRESSDDIADPDERVAAIRKRHEEAARWAMAYNGAQLAEGEDALKDALRQQGSPGVRCLVWAAPPAVYGAVFWIHPAWSTLNFEQVKEIAHVVARDRQCMVWWVKCTATKWEVLALSRPDISSDFIATVTPAGAYEIVGVS